ncbi:Sulfotransferase 6B1 [Bulinus truncatus]|nr:Sulfotransferase 6B1 [Bulinus truncatus]
MFQVLKNCLYNLIVWTHILYYVLPRLFLFLEKLLDPEKLCNHHIADESGATIPVTRCNGRNFPVVDVKKILSIPDIKIRNDDILLCSYPKAGCHWLFEILYMMVNRSTKMSSAGKDFAGDIDVMPNIFLDSIPSRRILNSHLPYGALPKEVSEKKIKKILLVRNPKDTVVSYYNHHSNCRHKSAYKGNFNDYFKLFMSGQLEFGNYFDYILDWNKILTNNNNNAIFLVSYEELKSDPLQVIRKIANFLNITIEESLAEKIIEACDLRLMKQKRMKENKPMMFYRKGIVGDWKNWLSDEQSLNHGIMTKSSSPSTEVAFGLQSFGRIPPRGDFRLLLNMQGLGVASYAKHRTVTG